MISLTGNVFLSYSEASVGPENIENLPSKYIQIIDRGLINIDHVSFKKQRIYYAKNLTQLFQEVPEEDFFSYISSVTDEDLYIYADEVSFREIYIRWMKGLFPKITHNEIYFLLQAQDTYETLLPNNRKSFVAFDNGGHQLNFEDIYSLYWDNNLEQIEGLFELYPAFKLPEQLKLFPSIEISLIQYILDKSSPVIPALLIQVNDLFKLKFMNEFGGICRTIKRNIFSTKLGREISIDVGFRLIKELEKTEEYKFLTDPKITEDLMGYSYLRDEYNLSECCSLLLSLSEELLANQGLDVSQSILDNPCTNHFIKNSNPPIPSSYLDNEILRKSDYEVLKLKVQCGELNLYLVDLFLKVKDEMSSFVNIENLLIIEGKSNEL